MTSCKLCGERLVFDTQNEEEESIEEVPDDLELRCGCHFHWSCLLDQSSELALSLKCPSCDTYLAENQPGPSTTNSFLPTSGATILAKYTNEGGIEPAFDILPSVTEEAYIATHPGTQPARAFHVMCAEGDIEGIVELLSSLPEADSEDELGVISVLRYQDPLSDMKSALHLAIERSKEEVALLLLWLCSTAPTESFPQGARQIVDSIGLGRLTVSPDNDIRGLKDSRGQTAAGFAQQAQGPWAAFLETGMLA